MAVLRSARHLGDARRADPAEPAAGASAPRLARPACRGRRDPRPRPADLPGGLRRPAPLAPAPRTADAHYRLDARMSGVEGPDFTVMFANIHAIRLRLCSAELLRKYVRVEERSDDEVLRASLTWFRGHDLAHFWRLADDAHDRGPAHSSLSAF